MNANLQLNIARHLAHKLHAGQKDKAGLPYVGHLARVAEGVGPDPMLQAVAWLHDAMEDCPVQPADLAQHGVADSVIAACQAITKRKGEDYAEYLARVAANPMAKAVKLADVADNMNLKRLHNPGPKDHARVAKYQKAQAFLLAA